MGNKTAQSQTKKNFPRATNLEITLKTVDQSLSLISYTKLDLPVSLTELKRVLPSLIDDDQTGFISNRYMGDNVRLIYDLINYLNTKNKPGLLLCLDFEKAFDSLDCRFMFRALRAFDFGKDLCRWIDTFYKKLKSTVIVNGQTSQWFTVERGCRQGDPTSPYIFILCVEILAIMIREDSNIKGIWINKVEHKNVNSQMTHN